MGKNQYIVQFGGLPVGVHEYEFEVQDRFFENIEHSEIRTADVKVKAFLTKQNNLLEMAFEIDGNVGVDCDRCLKNFGFPVSSREKLVIKHGNPDETTDEILVIPEGQDEFDVSHFLYEYITLALPARRVPCEIDAEKYACDQETLDRLEHHRVSEEGEQGENNPLWEKLNNIKFNKN